MGCWVWPLQLFDEGKIGMQIGVNPGIRFAEKEGCKLDAILCNGHREPLETSFTGSSKIPTGAASAEAPANASSMQAGRDVESKIY